MNLRDYLHFQRIKKKDFAKILDVSVALIGGYVNGKIRVSKKVAKAIEKATGGEVSAKEVIRDNPEKNVYKK